MWEVASSLASVGLPKLREEGTGLEEEEVRAGQSLSWGIWT